jgi:hypothetical protein
LGDRTVGALSVTIEKSCGSSKTLSPGKINDERKNGRNPTLYADKHFFSSSFHGFSPDGMAVQRSGSGQIGDKSPYHSLTSDQP